MEQKDAFEHQPSRGLEKLFGCMQKDVHLGPDRWKHLKFIGSTGLVGGGVYKQSYIPTKGIVSGTFENGEAAVVDNNYGKGRTRLIGSVPGYAYHLNADEKTRRFFASHQYYGKRTPHVSLPFNSGIIPRLWANKDRCFLWLSNNTTEDQIVIVKLNTDIVEFSNIRVLRGENAEKSKNILEIKCPQRDAVVIELTR